MIRYAMENLMTGEPIKKKVLSKKERRNITNTGSI